LKLEIFKALGSLNLLKHLMRIANRKNLDSRVRHIRIYSGSWLLLSPRPARSTRWKALPGDFKFEI